MPYVLRVFYPTASATAYGRRSKFVRAEHSATAEGENSAYGPTLVICCLFQVLPVYGLAFLLQVP